nr:SNF-related serine/threonine-protein kinase-like [Anolis sagrei ordinatus]
MSSSSASSSSSSCSPAEGQIAGLYDLEGTLGKGHFAVVRLARHVFTGERVAVKVIDKGKLRGGGAVAQLLQEVRCMKLVQHPNVVRLYEVIDTQAKLYLILELGSGGDMFDHLLRHEGGLGEERAKHYFAQIVHAIAYCHRLHVVHRDLKPENVVFFQEQSVVKLTDFGFSNCFQPGSMLATSCGSLAYSAPEILLGDEYEAPAVGKACQLRLLGIVGVEVQNTQREGRSLPRHGCGGNGWGSGRWSASGDVGQERP